jgi:hypothetical protein
MRAVEKGRVMGCITVRGYTRVRVRARIGWVVVVVEVPPVLTHRFRSPFNSATEVDWLGRIRGRE